MRTHGSKFHFAAIFTKAGYPRVRFHAHLNDDFQILTGLFDESVN